MERSYTGKTAKALNQDASSSMAPASSISNGAAEGTLFLHDAFYDSEQCDEHEPEDDGRMSLTISR